MPWCDGCDRFWNPNSLPEDGRCPVCERAVARPGRVARAGGAATSLVEEQEAKAPWHFKLLVVAISGYLGWRAVQALEWVLQRF